MPISDTIRKIILVPPTMKPKKKIAVCLGKEYVLNVFLISNAIPKPKRTIIRKKK